MALITLFSAPKPFIDSHIATIQRNAIKSWTLLPDVDVPTFMYMAVGAATLPYMLHRDVEKVQGVDVFDDDVVRRHADAMIATFLRRIEND